MYKYSYVWLMFAAGIAIYLNLLSSVFCLGSFGQAPLIIILMAGAFLVVLQKSQELGVSVRLGVCTSLALYSFYKL